MSDLADETGGVDAVARALEVALSEGGRSLVRDPRRVQAMVNDILGAASRAHRAEVDAVVLAAEEDIPAELLAGRTDLVDALTRLRTRGLDDVVATVAIDAWRDGLGALGAAGRPPSRGNAHDDAASSATDPPPASLTDPGFGHLGDTATFVTPHRPGPERDRPRWQWRTIAMIAFVAAAICLAATVVVWLRGRAQADDWKERAIAAEAALSRAEAAPSEVVRERDQVGDDTSARDDIDDLESRLDTATSELETVRSDLRDRSRELREAQEPFVTGTLEMGEAAFSGTGQLTDCSGFDADGCGQERWLRGTMRHDGTQQLFDVDGTAAVPLTTDNGLTWAGSAAVTGEYNFHSCNGVRSDTTMSVLIVPKEFRVDPTAQTVEVASFDVAFSFTSPASGCTAATVSYVGRLTSE